MRKITNKYCILSTTYLQEYAAWEEGTSSDKSFNTYTSSNFRHYCSIKMELLRCQGGLCAYTERNLCPPELYDESNWSNGAYTGNCKELRAAKGQLEHFDSSLKKASNTSNTNQEPVRPRPWDWENLFFVDSDANTKKLENSIDPRFKPDNPTYDPLDWLDYDIDTHQFVPKDGLTPTEEKEVEKMLKILGIDAAYNDRRRYLKDKLSDIENGFKTVQAVRDKIDEFPTAFYFCLQKMNLEDERGTE